MQDCGRACAWLKVALRKESVDRNNPFEALVILAKVALRKESVDRNSIYIRSIR